VKPEDERKIGVENAVLMVEKEGRIGKKVMDLFLQALLYPMWRKSQ
jgi:hypothetical protein